MSEGCGNRRRICSGSHPEFIANILVTQGSNGPRAQGGLSVCKEGVLFLRTRVEEIRPPTERKDEQTSGSQRD